MGDDVRERGCEQYSDDLAELALGVLTGRERAQVLAHVESCPRCADELEHLSRVADTVVQSAPEMEPPLGFEVRLFERMGVTDVRPRRRRFRPSRWVPAAVGVAAAALVLGLGLGLTSSSAPTVAAKAHRQQVTTAALVENGERVGHVVTVRRQRAVDVDDLGRLGRPRHRELRGRHRRRRQPPRRDLRGPRRLWGVERSAARGPGRRAHGGGRVAQRDGARHRHAGLTTAQYR